jgi:N-acetylglucosamine-6-phosphate deacetylase
MQRITDVRLPRRPGETSNPALWWLQLDAAGCIDALGPMPERAALRGQSWNGDWLSPMGVDLQINGGLGLAFPELTEADLPRLLQLLDQLWRDGVEAIAPTLVTCAVEPLRRALAVLRQAREQHQPQRCCLLGAHLEGPFLAEARRGAHPREHLCAPSLEALEQRIAGFEHEISLVTLAPELTGAEAVIERLRALGIVVALGHSAADADQAHVAFDRGVAMLTHSFNAMAGLHHRSPGPVGEACRRGDVALGLIADGVHVSATMAVLLQRLAGDRLVLVSDALAPYGLADGQHRWDERVLRVENGTCRLEDGTLAGVTLPLLEGVRRLARWGGECEGAIWAATLAPRAVLAGSDVEAIAWRSLLLHQPLANLLRWSAGADGDLHWRHAA